MCARVCVALDALARDLIDTHITSSRDNCSLKRWRSALITHSARRRSSAPAQTGAHCAWGWDRISTQALTIRIAVRPFCAGRLMEAAVSREDCNRFATQFLRGDRRHYWIEIIAWCNWRGGWIRDRSVKTVASRWPTPRNWPDRPTQDELWVREKNQFTAMYRLFSVLAVILTIEFCSVHFIKSSYSWTNCEKTTHDVS